MKAIFESVDTPGNSSFLVRKFKERQFSAPYHYHPEYECTLIVAGTGTRYVGTHIQDFFPGDLVILGPNVPHCWRTGGDPATESVSVVLHFREDFMGEHFFRTPEMSQVSRMLENSNYGLCFPGGFADIKEKMGALHAEENNPKKLLRMLDLLVTLSIRESTCLLQKQSLYAALPLEERERISHVLAYMIDHFQDKISLAVAAGKVNMTIHAFCKYFKRTTRKTFIEAVNDYRIDLAVRQLIHSDRSISQICFDCGFNDLSNFHKAFKVRRKMSPLTYRNIFQKEMSEDFHILQTE